jgi:hypothetical protein
MLSNRIKQIIPKENFYNITEQRGDDPINVIITRDVNDI